MTIRKWFRMYCEKTTSHGVQYLVMRHRSSVEKLFWIIVFLYMTTVAIYFIQYIIVYVWLQNPTMIFTENTETSIREIPFPAITICPLNQIRKRVWDHYKNTNSSYWKYLQQYRSLTCSAAYRYIPINIEYESIEFLENDSIGRLVHDSAVSCSELLQTGMEWQNITLKNACQFVQPMLSLMGICYKINMLPASLMFHNNYLKKYFDFFSKNYSYVDFKKTRWNLDDGYSSYSDSDKKVLMDINPARTSGISYYHSLRVNMHTLSSEFMRCPQINLVDGYLLIALSNPSEFHPTTSYSYIASDTHTKIQIIPSVRKINSNLVLHSPKVRKCYMHNERNLSIFKLYTESNCYNECWVNMTTTMCSCVVFNMAFLMTADVKVCGPSKTDCTIKAKQAMNTPKIKIKCNCLPTCSDINYEITYTSSFQSWDYLKTTQLVKNKWFRMFCEKATCHGVQYLVMKHRSPVEKLFWTLNFLCMTAVAVSFIQYIIVYVWLQNPTMIFTENTETPIREIPFPAITICSINQIRKWVWDRYKNTNTSYWRYLKKYRSLICREKNYIPISMEHQSIEYLDNDLIESIVRDTAVSCSEIFQTGMIWENITFLNVCEHFQPMLTMMGLCYKFNMVPAHQIFHSQYYERYVNFFSKNNSYIGLEKTQWNLDDGYSRYSDRNELGQVNPARTSSVSYYNRLRVNLHTMPDEFMRCPLINLADGYFLIALSNPSEFRSTTPYSYIALDTYTKIQIIPSMRRINSDLVIRSPEVRKCYMHNERKLSIYKLYTESNCYNECWVNLTITMCSCILFNMAFLKTAAVNVCGPSQTYCTIKAKQTMNTLSMQMKCKCFPTCSEINYEVTASSNFESWDYLKTTQLVQNSSKGASVELVFKNPYFTAYRSASILDVNSLISAIGGILSLLLGWSIINICEILYVIIKMFYNCYVYVQKLICFG